jgi:hypothetical protein
MSPHSAEKICSPFRPSHEPFGANERRFAAQPKDATLGWSAFDRSAQCPETGQRGSPEFDEWMIR